MAEVGYEIGEHVVHQQYGVARIVDLTTKSISGEPKEYYELETNDFTLWVTPEQLKSDTFRPVATIGQMDAIKDVLSGPADTMAEKFNNRKARIQRVLKKNNPIDLARLVRDLWGHRQIKRSLNQTEQGALENSTTRLVREWAAAMRIQPSEAKQRMTNLLNSEMSAAAAD